VAIVSAAVIPLRRATPPAPRNATPTLAARLSLRQNGYVIVYHADTVNHCPSCGKSHWWVGRITAQCAFCATALPLANRGSRNDA